jgi:hypothetical protein
VQVINVKFYVRRLSFAVLAGESISPQNLEPEGVAKRTGTRFLSAVSFLMALPLGWSAMPREVPSSSMATQLSPRLPALGKTGESSQRSSSSQMTTALNAGGNDTH